jgi:dephospho-CoA kinase
VALDMAVYFKSRAKGLADAVVLVDAPLGLRVRRLMARGRKSRPQALAQAKALRFGAAERRKADLVIRNTASAASMLKYFEGWVWKNKKSRKP